MSKVKQWPISYLVREIRPPSSKSGGNLPDISDAGTLDRGKKAMQRRETCKFGKNVFWMLVV